MWYCKDCFKQFAESVARCPFCNSANVAILPESLAKNVAKMKVEDFSSYDNIKAKTDDDFSKVGFDENIYKEIMDSVKSGPDIFKNIAGNSSGISAVNNNNATVMDEVFGSNDGTVSYNGTENVGNGQQYAAQDDYHPNSKNLKTSKKKSIARDAVDDQNSKVKPVGAVSVSEWFWFMLLTLLPVVGFVIQFIILIYWLSNSKVNPSKKSFAVALLIFSLIAVAIVSVLGFILWMEFSKLLL